VPVYPTAEDPYASLTPVELATFGIGPARTSDDDDNDVDEEAANDDKETEDDD
jgi:hypothetical protein